MSSYPFLQQRFLALLEESGSVCEATGWRPVHLDFASRGQQVFMPLYAKDHSWGEYVFDWAWADAYRRLGLEYYPKLLTAIPFTPVTGPRIRGKSTPDKSLAAEVVQRVLTMAEDEGYPSWHLLFPDQPTLETLLEVPRLIHRTGVQYHWHNREYDNFAHFLGSLKSRKRKMIRRERQSVRQGGFEVQMLTGKQLDPAIWSFFYRLYVRTYVKRSGSAGYLTEAFFRGLGNVMPDQVAMALAFRGREPVAAALYFFDQDTLYGRYWGCAGEYEHLHFELCYYQGIQFAIERGLKRFDAGAQGEHKILRGFEPVLTHSLHWIREPRLARAIGDFVEREHRHNLLHISQAESLLPYSETYREKRGD